MESEFFEYPSEANSTNGYGNFIFATGSDYLKTLDSKHMLAYLKILTLFIVSSTRVRKLVWRTFRKEANFYLPVSKFKI